MMSTILFIVAGFTAGIFYSRGKADPVQAAVFDLKRLLRTAGRFLKLLWRKLRSCRYARSWDGQNTEKGSQP